MKIHLQYGRDGLEVDVPSANLRVIEPTFVEGLPDEAAAFVEAVRRPIGTRPLRDVVRATDRVAVVIPDITRPLPSDRLLRWILAELSHVPERNFVIVNGTGSHRVNTPDELAAMVGADVLARMRVVNHDSHDASTLSVAGKTRDGHTVRMARDYVEADRRIVLGFIEPHFMAGFSGGYKGVFPAVADIDSIMHYHRAQVIGDARSTWGVLDGNPTQEQIRFNGSLVPVDFLINVTQNRKRQITRFFCGDVLAAHAEGCTYAKTTAMVACEHPFPIVVTTNAGYPLDQNLYQAVKGMSAAAQIVEQDGLVLQASRCNDGFPSHGNFRKLLFDHASPRALLDTITAPGFSLYDQWEAQLLAIIALKARVGLYSDLAPDEVSRAHLEAVADVGARLRDELARRGADTPIAVLPEGPMTIPYLSSGGPSEGPRPPPRRTAMKTTRARRAIERMVGYTPGEQPSPGEKVIKLNTNENPFPPSPKVMAAIHGIDPEWLRRYPNSSADAFREVAARVHGVTTDAILAGNGSDEILAIVLRAFLGPGDLLATPHPTYSLYPVLAEIGEVEMAEVPWAPGWDLPTDALVATGARAIFFANPNAPSGTMVSPDHVRALADRFDGLVLVDEAYVDFADVHCLPLVATHPNVVVCRTLSKAYSLAGIRFGYAVAAPGLIAEMMKVKDSYNCDAISIAAACAALADQEYARGTWQHVRGERTRLSSELARRGWGVLPSQANFLLASVPGGAAGVLYRTLKAQGILVRWFDKPGLRDKLRITVGTRTENDALLAAL